RRRDHQAGLPETRDRHGRGQPDRAAIADLDRQCTAHGGRQRRLARLTGERLPARSRRNLGIGRRPVGSQQVCTCLLDPLVVVYGEPKTADVGAFLREYAGIMSDFTAEELMHAKATIMRKHEFKSFPTPAECLKACAEARKELSPVWGDRMRARIE